jgi:hypothetical protein
VYSQDGRRFETVPPELVPAARAYLEPDPDPDEVVRLAELERDVRELNRENFGGA